MKNNKKIIKGLSLAALTTTVAGSIAGITLNVEQNSNSASNNASLLSNETKINSRAVTRPTKKATITGTFANNNPVEIAYVLNKLAQNIPTNKDTLKTKLSELFDNVDTLDTNAYTFSNINALANAATGELRVGFYITTTSGQIVTSASASFSATEGLTSGTTKIAKYDYVDSTNTYSQIKTKLRVANTALSSGDAFDYITTTSGILTGLATAGENKSSIKIDYIANDNTQVITINNIKVTNAIEPTTLNTSEVTLNGPIVIKGTDSTTSKTTSLILNNAYLSDPAFATINDANEFKAYVDNKKTDTTTINLLVKTINPAPSATISITSATISGNSVDVVFSVDQYYDEYGVLKTNGKEFTINYATFCVVTNTTYVKTENIITLPNKDYAYQYDISDLNTFVQTLTNNVIINPVGGSVATVKDPVYNNMTGMITATVNLDKYFDENGAEQANKDFTNIKFKVPKIITAPTYAQRNATTITETINEIDAKNDGEKKTWAQKYIEVINPMVSPATVTTITNVTKASQSSSSGQIGNSDCAVYNVTVELTNYFAYDATFSAKVSGKKLTSTIRLVAKVNQATDVTATVKQSGIAADGKLLTDYVKEDFTVLKEQTAMDDLKTWIVSKQANIFENYTFNNDIADILEITATNDDDGIATTMDVTVKLKNSITPCGYTNDASFSFEITNLVENKWTKNLKEVVVDLSATQGTVFASDYTGDKANDIANEIKTNNGTKNYFENLPASYATDGKVFVIGSIIDDVSGTIIVDYQLSKFYVKGQEVTQTQANEAGKNAITYRAKITGFKNFVTNDVLNGLNLTLTGGQLNTSVNNNVKVDAYDYQQAIVDEVNRVVTANNASIPTNMRVAIIAAIAKNKFSFEFKYDSISSQNNISTFTNAKVLVKNNDLATASKNDKWSLGYEFNLTNATYVNTKITTTTNSNYTLTFDDFTVQKKTAKDKLAALNTTIDGANIAIYGTDYTNPENLVIDVTGDNVSGKAIVTLTFNKYFINNTEVDNYKTSFNFQFKPSTPPTSIDYLKDTVAKSIFDPTISQSATIQEALTKFTDPSNKTAIDGILNNNKNQLVNSIDTLTSYPNLSFEFASATLTSTLTEDTIALNITIKHNNVAIAVETVNVGAYTSSISATNPTVASTRPVDLTYDNIETYIGNSAKYNTILTFTASKTPKNEDVAIKTATLDSKQKTEKMAVAYVDFTFNGIYKTNKLSSFVENYVVKVKIDFNATRDIVTKMTIVWQGASDSYISADTLNKKPSNNWIIATIFGAFFIVVLVSLATKAIYKKKLEIERNR